MTRRTLGELLRRRVGRDRQLREVRETARAQRAEVWLVGGYVRDTALGLHPHDVDLVAGRGSARLVTALAAAWGVRAFRFRKRGVTTWRLVHRARRIDVVDAARRGLERDLRRRDLTINAVAYDLAAARVHDPLGGLSDLRGGRLRLPRERALADDPVRAVRVARFLAQLPRFRLLAATRQATRRAAPLLRRASVERAREELDKLLCAAAPERGLDALAELGLLGPVLPELTPLCSCRAGSGRPDVWTHSVEAIALTTRAGALRLPGARCAAAAEARRIVRWTLLLHDISKPETLAVDATGRPTFHGHEVLGAERAEALLRRLRAPLRDRRRIRALVRLHLRPGHLADAGATERGLRRLVLDAGDDLPLLVLHAACDARASGSPDARPRWRRLQRVLRRLLELHEDAQRAPLPRLAGGRDLMRELGLEPGPRIGQLLAAIEEQQQLGAVRNRADALDLARRLLALGAGE